MCTGPEGPWGTGGNHPQSRETGSVPNLAAPALAGRRSGASSEEDEMGDDLERLEDLDVTKHEAAQVKGGVPPRVPDVSVPLHLPPGVPIPYPNTPPVKK